MYDYYDLIVYGAGPAGIFFTKNFINSKTKILLVEPGNYKKQILFEPIKNNGPFTFSNEYERAKSFFGTASFWLEKGRGGKLFTFDKCDIDNKWAIKKDDLDIFYNKLSNEIEKIYHAKINDDFVVPDNHKSYFMDKFNKNDYQVKFGSYRLADGFEKIYESLYKDLIKSKNINIIFNSKLSNLKIDRVNKKISGAEIIYNNKKIFVRSKYHILSTGCFESNRIMLDILKDDKEIIEKYKIGKKITFHPSVKIGDFISQNPISERKLLGNIDNRNKIMILKKNNDLNLNLGLSINFEQNLSQNIFIRKTYNKFIKKYKLININLIFEHLPSDQSFIKIISDNNKSDIEMNTFMSDENILLVKKAHNYFSNDIKKILEPLFKFNQAPFDINYETNNHHHGGLEFGEKNSQPVDKNLKFKEFSNLFINGSSVFPTSSIYNPTYTIMALALRLSEHIKKLLI